MSCKKAKIIYDKEPEKSVIIVKFNKKNGMAAIQPRDHPKLSKLYFINDKSNGKIIWYYENGYIQRIFYNIKNKINNQLTI